MLFDQLTKEHFRKIPLFTTKVAAGFPSPADDYLEQNLDLNEYLIAHPAATFFVRATGDSMINAGIFPDDMLIVDKSLTAQNRDVVIAVVDGEFTVKRLLQQEGGYVLAADNPRYAAITINQYADVSIWGVVTYVIHNVKRSKYSFNRLA